MPNVPAHTPVVPRPGPRGGAMALWRRLDRVRAAVLLSLRGGRL
jgi:hypothetical protein